MEVPGAIGRGFSNDDEASQILVAFAFEMGRVSGDVQVVRAEKVGKVRARGGAIAGEIGRILRARGGRQNGESEDGGQERPRKAGGGRWTAGWRWKVVFDGVMG